MNVLLTCVGLRVDNVLAYRAALGAAGVEGIVVGVDADDLAPALHFCDVYGIVPAVVDDTYAEHILELVERHAIRLVAPLSDLDVVLLAGLEDELAERGAIAWVPPAPAAEVCVDKLAMAGWLAARGLPTPRTFAPDELPGDVAYPVLVKMREGSGSANIFRASTPAELDFFVSYAPVPVVVQELCDGVEYSSDIFCDRSGRLLNIVSRTMLAWKGGETIRGESFVRDDLTDVVRTVAEALPLRGPACIQAFETAPGRFEITDINPRTGGSFPLPLAAATIPFPELAVRLALGQRIDPHIGSIEPGLILSRFFHQIMLRRQDDGTLVPLALSSPVALALPDPPARWSQWTPALSTAGRSTAETVVG
jgi:carbamoyl-phosphate synthase large subunit